MKVFVKRIQTRASRKGIKVSLQQVRDAYQSIVKDLENPSDEEIDLVLSKLQSSIEKVSEALTIPEPATVEITEESNADIWEILQPEDNAIASDLAEPEEETPNTVVQECHEVQLKVEETQLDRIEPERALAKTEGYTLPEEEKHSLIHRQASALNVELNTSELTTIAGNIADNYASFEEAVERIKSIILLVLDQRFQRASDVLDNTLLTILNRASGNFQSLNGRASQGFTAIAQELKRVDTDFKSKSSELERSLKQYLI